MDNIISIRQLFQVEPLSLDMSQMFMSLGVTPKELEDVGISVSVAVPYPNWCRADEAKELNAQCYESIMEHKDLYDFITMYGFKELEELKECTYTNIHIWVRIADRSSLGHNRLIVTRGHAPNRYEAFYNAKDYAEFWDMVDRLTDMYKNPDKDHEPVTLYKENGMIGTAYKKWTITVK